jgi:hypothetical protein
MCMIGVDVSSVTDRLTAMSAESSGSYTTECRRDLECGPGRLKGAPVFRYCVERALSDLEAVIAPIRQELKQRIHPSSVKT